MARHVNVDTIGHVGHQLTRVAACVRHALYVKNGVLARAKS